MEHGFQGVQLQFFVYFLVNALILLFAYPLIYIFEKTFGFLSNVTLLELSGANNKLIQRFSEEAPGSFQHSLQVSNLAADAAMKIGANSFLARTGALYHDIGKLSAPVYFSENQSGGKNPLNDLSYEDAAQKVISHVGDGVKLAQKAGVPEKIIDFIRSHHGNRQATYFYNSFKNAFPGEPVNEEAFTYKGTLPNTKEMAIVSMADAVEAASRSLPEYSETTINNLVDRIVDGQVADGMFKQTPITFAQLETVKNVFKEKLKNIYHSRISYPELKKEK
jgi:putative nucleotidyltransferase with HDIG domain